MTVDAARRAAADLLLAVDERDAYANLVLPRLLRERGITGRDAAFATELGYGALRLSGVLDPVIAAGARRDVADLDPPVRAVLRLGAYQLLHLRVPAHAAVSQSVELVKQLTGPKPSGLVNAVLRRIAETDWDGWVDRLAPRDDAVGRLAFRYGYPRWIAAAFADALGGDRVELAAALAADRPHTHLVARPARISRAALLAQAGDGATPGPWSEYAVHLAGGHPGALPAIRDRRAGVQDEGSQLAALVVTRAPVDGTDARWLDLCAGPGGKAAILAGLASSDARLLANDRLAHRARLVRQVLGGGWVVTADGTRRPWRDSWFDRVLLDAPCTGLGALRRRPEARWRRLPGDVDRLADVQRQLLDSAITSARPGGLVCYVTCSPHRAETLDVVAAVTGHRDDTEPVDVRPLLSGVPALGAGPHVQLWPHRHGTDAIFIALLRRRL